MAYKTYTELSTQAAEIKNETDTGENTATRVGTMLEDFNDSKDSREFNRTFSETLVFDKNEIFHTPAVQTAVINLTIGAGGLVDEASSMRLRITLDGVNPVNFGPGFDFLYGITNGQILEAGTYEFYLLYTNGSVSVNVPGISSQSSGATLLATPSNFAAVADGENAIDLSWTDVANESSYLIEFSLTGTGGWATLSTPAANATTSTQTGLSAGDTRFYRIKAIGDGVNFLDSAFSSVISGQTQSGGDVTAPTFTFLPASGNTVWTVNAPITITANEPIRNTDGSAITDANVSTRITLKETNSGGTNIAFIATIDATKTIITIAPTTHYGENQLVYVAINNVEDVNGNEVTVAISSTFTTTEYTLFNGTSNFSRFGDILDSLFAAVDTNFWLEITINNALLSGTRRLVTKNETSGNQRSFTFYYTNTDVYFFWTRTGTSTAPRLIKWTGALSAGEHILVLKYDGSIDSNNGLDRATLLVDGVIAGSKTLDSAGSTLGAIFSGTAQLALGADVNSAGTAIGGLAQYEAKDFIVRSTSGTVVEINVPNIKTGEDTSGNNRDGTWV